MSNPIVDCSSSAVSAISMATITKQYTYTWYHRNGASTNWLYKHLVWKYW